MCATISYFQICHDYYTIMEKLLYLNYICHDEIQSLWILTPNYICEFPTWQFRIRGWKTQTFLTTNSKCSLLVERQMNQNKCAH